MSNESTLQNFAKRLAKELNTSFYKINSPAHRGIPDALFVDRGFVYFIEFKSPTGKGRVSPLQALTIQDLRLHGATVYVINDYDLLELLMLAIHAERLNIELQNFLLCDLLTT